MPIVHPNKKLGKRAERRDPRTFKLSRYLIPALPTPPVEAGYIGRIRDWRMLLNDQIGNCVVAAAAHMEMQWTAYSGHPFVPSEQDVLMDYERIGGYDPTDPSTDNGCDMLTALKYWRKRGIAGRKILAYVSVNKYDPQEVAQAIYLFGNVYAGLGLPTTVQDADVWQVPECGPVGDGSPWSWGGHCVPIVGYSLEKENSGVDVVSWGQIYPMTWPFIHYYADEFFAVLSEDWIASNGQACNGFNIDQLRTDLKAL